MCIIVDVNNLARVFNPKNAEHNEFIPVYEWILTGSGKLVIGGSTFDKEISINKWFLPFLSQLSRIGKVIKMPNEIVDVLEEKIKIETPIGVDFDDQHLVSLLAVSKCKLICSDDNRAYEHFKNNINLNGHRAKIYSSSRNRDLLIDRNICDHCKPAKKISKDQSSVLKVISNNLKK